MTDARLSTRIAAGRIRAAATDHVACLRQVGRAFADLGYQVTGADHTTVGGAHAGVLHLQVDGEHLALEWSDASLCGGPAPDQHHDRHPRPVHRMVPHGRRQRRMEFGQLTSTDSRPPHPRKENA